MPPTVVCLAKTPSHLRQVHNLCRIGTIGTIGTNDSVGQMK